MALSPGTWLNHYEILAHIGSGGMGEVYRANDNKLKREVALKVLPEHFARDPERVARFRREAQLLAQLNHPNIALIYNFEEAGETRFLVMELAHGDTLRDRIKRGPVPVDESLKISKQIAEALEHAHEKPIIHRDLKPANIKVTPAGVVKVLDFGLAKAFATAGKPIDPADIPTGSQHDTLKGTILGTPAYMSPEQARGKETDKRTDIWSFGCVLYELLTGKQAFQGETVTEILASVLKSEPDWTALPEATPSNIRALLRRCLQKEAKRRLRDAADVQIEIEETITASATTVPAPVPAVPPRSLWQRAMPSLLTAIVAVVIAGGVAIWNRPAPTPQRVSRLVVPLAINEQLAQESAVAVSPDGAHLAYVVYSGQAGAITSGGISVVGRLYVRSMDSSETTLIAEATRGRAFNPFFSPDGQWIGFFADSKLKKVAVSGGAALTLSDAPDHRGGSWGPDDTILFAPEPNDGLWRVSSAGGAPQKLTTLEADEASHRWPQFLPDAKGFLFTAVPKSTTDVNEYNVAVQGLDNGENRVLIRGGSFGRYVPTGNLVYYRAGTMMAVPFDLARLEVTGNPVPVVEGVGTFRDWGLAQFSFSGSGSLVYAEGRSADDLESTLVWVDRRGVAEPLPARPGVYGAIRLSPDGRRVAMTVAQSNSVDIWVYDITRDTLTRLTSDGNNFFPGWTPDGKKVRFESYTSGERNLFWKPADGSGPEEPVIPGEQLARGEISPDGRVFVYLGDTPTTKRDLWVVPLEGERKPRLFLQTPFNETGARWSPDGRWLAYVSDQSGRVEVYIRPFPGPGGEVQVSTDGASAIVGWRDGELFYRAGTNAEKMMVVESKTEPTLSVGKPRLLFESSYAFAGSSVTPDGQRFLMLKPSEQQNASLTQIHVVLNWFEELKRRVPAAR